MSPLLKTGLREETVIFKYNPLFCDISLLKSTYHIIIMLTRESYDILWQNDGLSK